MPARTKPQPQIRDLIEDDARVVAVEGFRVYPIGREIRKGEYLTLNEAVVRQHPSYFALVVPVSEVLSGEVER